MITRIMYLGAAYPQWTFSEFALAEVGMNTGEPEGLLDRNITSTASQITLEVPAIRGVINCTSRSYSSARKMPSSSFGSSGYYNDLTKTSLLEVNMTLPTECVTTETLANNLHLTKYDNGVLSTSWEYKPGIIGLWYPNSFSSAPCRLSLGLFGEIDTEGTIKDLTLFSCTPYVEMLQVASTFDFPSFNLTSPVSSNNLSGPSSPVTPLESTAKFFNNDSLATKQPGLQPGLLNGNLKSMNLSRPSPLSCSDPFFQALFQGIESVSDPRSVLGATNTKRLFSAMDHLYGILMAQSLNTVQGRRVSATADAPQPFNGLLSYPGHRRLMQSAAATYILVALLAVMLLCAVMTLVTFKAGGLVSMEMNSIAARASLLAGAGMLDMVPERAEWCSDEELEMKGVFEGLGLRLGWWEGKEREGGRYGIDVVKE